MALKKLKTKAKKPPGKNKIRACHYCLQQVNSSAEHKCIPLTENNLLQDLNEDLRDAFEILKKRTRDFGKQKVYNNARAVMFARSVCFMFVRPKKSYLELCFFLPRKETNMRIARIVPVSKNKFSHTFKLIHADQVEEPLLNWLREAFEQAK